MRAGFPQERVEQTFAGTKCDCLRTALDTHLAHDPLDVGSHGLWAQVEALGDLRLGEAVDQETEDLTLARSQSEEVIVRRRWALLVQAL